MSTNVSTEREEQLNCVNMRQKLILERLILEKFGTKQALADKIGWTRPMISQIVHGHIKPTTAQKIKIAHSLGVDSRTIWEDKK